MTTPTFAPGEREVVDRVLDELASALPEAARDTGRLFAFHHRSARDAVRGHLRRPPLPVPRHAEIASELLRWARMRDVGDYVRRPVLVLLAATEGVVAVEALCGSDEGVAACRARTDGFEGYLLRRVSGVTVSSGATTRG